MKMKGENFRISENLRMKHNCFLIVFHGINKLVLEGGTKCFQSVGSSNPERFNKICKFARTDRLIMTQRRFLLTSRIYYREKKN